MRDQSRNTRDWGRIREFRPQSREFGLQSRVIAVRCYSESFPRSCSSVCDRSRETCICEMPMRSAICVWV